MALFICNFKSTFHFKQIYLRWVEMDKTLLSKINHILKVNWNHNKLQLFTQGHQPLWQDLVCCYDPGKHKSWPKTKKGFQENEKRKAPKDNWNKSDRTKAAGAVAVRWKNIVWEKSTQKSSRGQVGILVNKLFWF